MDVYMDILRILLPNKIRNQVEAINEGQNSISLRIEILSGNNLHQRAIENIEITLNDYAHFLNG